MLNNGQNVAIKTFVPQGVVVQRKFFGEGRTETIQYLVEFTNAAGEVGTRWFTEDELQEM